MSCEVQRRRRVSAPSGLADIAVANKRTSAKLISVEEPGIQSAAGAVEQVSCIQDAKAYPQKVQDLRSPPSQNLDCSRGFTFTQTKVQNRPSVDALQVRAVRLPLCRGISGLPQMSEVIK